MALLQGNFLDALYWNPFGLLLIAVLAVTPAWVAIDLIARKNSLQKFYLQTEQLLRQKSVAIPAILIVLGNWCWNIYKGL